MAETVFFEEQVIRFVDQLDREWIDISSEKYREYTFPEYNKIVIRAPLKLFVSKSGGHRVFDSEGRCHYISPRWLEIIWEPKDGSPHFVA